MDPWFTEFFVRRSGHGSLILARPIDPKDWRTNTSCAHTWDPAAKIVTAYWLNGTNGLRALAAAMGLRSAIGASHNLPRLGCMWGDFQFHLITWGRSNLTIYLIQCFLGWDHSPESNYSPSLQSWKWSIFVQSSFKMSTKILSWVFGKGSFSTSMFVAGRDQKLAEQKLWGHKNHVGVLDSWHFLGGNPKTKTICDLVYRFSVLYHGISLNPCICKLGPQNAGRVGWILEGAFPHQWPRGSPMPYWVKFCLSNNNRFAAGQWEILRCSGCPTRQVRRIRSTQLWWNVPQLMWNTSKR